MLKKNSRVIIISVASLFLVLGLVSVIIFSNIFSKNGSVVLDANSINFTVAKIEEHYPNCLFEYNISTTQKEELDVSLSFVKETLDDPLDYISYDIDYENARIITTIKKDFSNKIKMTVKPKNYPTLVRSQLVECQQHFYGFYDEYYKTLAIDISKENARTNEILNNIADLSGANNVSDVYTMPLLDSYTFRTTQYILKGYSYGSSIMTLCSGIMLDNTALLDIVLDQDISLSYINNFIKADDQGNNHEFFNFVRPSRYFALHFEVIAKIEREGKDKMVNCDVFCYAETSRFAF